MSVNRWRYTEACDSQPCPGDCDECGYTPELIIPLRKRKAGEILDELVGFIDKFVPNKEHAIIILAEVMAFATVMSEEQMESTTLEAGETYSAGDAAEIVRHGHWEHEHCANPEDDTIRCSVCGKRKLIFETRYCPNCGARMDKEGEDG